MVSQRFREQGDQLQIGAQADLAVAPWLTLGAGMLRSVNEGRDEWRTHQQVSLIAGSFQLRTRLEERFYDGAPRAQLRLRERVQVTIPLVRRQKLTFSGELHYIARPERTEDTARVDQWRLLAMYTRPLAPRLDVGLGYMMIIAPREGAPDRMSHSPQLTLGYRF